MTGTGEGDRVAGHARLHEHDPGAGSDTAGNAWAGRHLSGSGFAGDTGAPDPRVREALNRLRECPPAQSGVREGELLEALGHARLFACVQAVAGHVDHSDGHAREVTSDMASPVLTAPDGRRAAPLFTGTDTLTAWRADARPVPVGTADAARAAIQDACDVMVLDIGTQSGYVLRLSHVWALAQERGWLPAHEDPTVQGALERAIAGRPDILAASLGDGAVHAPGVTRVVLTLRSGLTPGQVRTVVQSVGDALAADPEVRIRVDDVAMVLRSADSATD